MNQPKYINVDDLQAQTTLQEAAARCGKELDVHGSGRQVRIDCAFGCLGDHVGKREISVDVANPQKVFCCHAYGCQMRGNLLALMYGWLTNARPAGEKLKGDEFKRVRDMLVGEPLSDRIAAPRGEAEASSEPVQVRDSNPPLAEHPNEKARELVTMHEKFVVDLAAMTPAAASYVRRHRCLTLDAMRKWRVGVLPLDGGGDKRGWSLRGQVIYPIDDENGRVLGYVGRDPGFEGKEQAFAAMTPAQRLKEKTPSKHRFPTAFLRGHELYGQCSTRLAEPGYREKIAQFGIVVVEGLNDVIGLDSLGVPAVGLMSNKLTVEQAAKIERWARAIAGGKVTLLFDADEAGDAGAKDALWVLAQRGLDVRLGWSRAMHAGKFAGRQPEDLAEEEWRDFIAPTISR